MYMYAAEPGNIYAVSFCPNQGLVYKFRAAARTKIHILFNDGKGPPL